MVDVFISYAKADAAAVRRLAEAVRGLGYSVWWDEELPPHLSYSDVITEKIGAAEAVIVVWSEKAIASEWVRAEADLARSQKKLVQTSIDGRIPPMPFNQLHFVSIGDWRGEPDHLGWVRVQESLAVLCKGAVTTPAHAFPSSAPPRPQASGGSFMRRAPMLVGGLLLLSAAGAAAFLLRGGGGAPIIAEAPAPAPAQRPAPRPRAPVAAAPKTEPVPLRPARPSASASPGPAQPRRRRAPAPQQRADIAPSPSRQRDSCKPCPGYRRAQYYGAPCRPCNAAPAN